MEKKRYVGVMVKCKDKILLCKRNNLGSFPGMWSIPGGKLEEKIKSGNLKESELLQEASEIMDKMKDIPGIKQMMSKMGMNGKMDFKGMANKMQQHMKGSKTKEQERKDPTPKPSTTDTTKEFSYINPKGKTIETRFLAPPGFVRDSSSTNSFTSYLRTLPLKPDGSPVLLYDGSQKGYQDGQCAVVNLPIGKKFVQLN
jgi:hypothetical protein